MTDPKSLARDAAEWLMYLGDLRSKADLELVAEAIYGVALVPLVKRQEQELALARAGALAEISEVAAGSWPGCGRTRWRQEGQG